MIQDERVKLKTPRAPAPHKRHSLAYELRTLVRTLMPGDRMPSVPDLMRDYGVSSSTAQAAIETLRQEGIVISRRGSGTFVADTSAGPPLQTRTLAALAYCPTPFYHYCVELLTEQATARGLSVLCRYIKDDKNHHSDLEELMALKAIQPVGFIVIGEGEKDLGAELLRRGQRVVQVGERFYEHSLLTPRVRGDAEAGGYLATRHLLDRGHRRLAYAHWLANNDLLFRSERWQGHLRALREAGLPPSACAVLSGGELQRWRDYPETLRSLRRSADAPTAIVAWGDNLAGVIIGTLWHAGLHVPEDMSVIGYDCLPLGESLYPPLDSVDQHLYQQIEIALDLLEDADPPPFDFEHIVTPSLRVRASCASPRRT